VAERERAELKKHRLPSQNPTITSKNDARTTSLSGEPTGALKGDQTYRSDKLYRRNWIDFFAHSWH